MDLRGPVVDVGETRTVTTRNGETDLAEVTIRPDRGASAPVTVTLWGRWTETAAHLAAGMDLLVTGAEEREFRGETQYSTTGDSFVVVEPDFLVTVTELRNWVDCPRLYYLHKLDADGLSYPMVKGTIVHEVFGDLLRGGDRERAVDRRVAEAGLELGLLGKTRDEVRAEAEQHAGAIEGWLNQGRFGADEWRSEQTLISERFGLRGRADAVRRGAPVELKTGKNVNRDPRFKDKIQAACYALLLGETGHDGDGALADGAPDTGTLIYTKNATLDRVEESGDLSPAKDFSISKGLLDYVVRTRNELAAAEFDASVPTGYEGNATCEYCFEQETCMAVAGRLDQESKAGQLAPPVPEDERDYFERTYRALEAERRAVHHEFVKLWEQTPRERADDDRALIDLDPIGRRELDGGRWELRARKPDDAVSKIREGDLVLASDGDPVRGTAELATVRRLGDEVVVTADEPLDLGRIDVYPSELSVDRQLSGLAEAVLRGDPDRKDVLFGRRSPAFSDEQATYVDNNDSQNAAVNLAVNAEDCALVHGPPGTGKTYTLARTVRALVERGDRVLVSAFTNRAVDNALAALRDQGFDDFVRVGRENGVRPDMHDALLDRTGDPDGRVAELRDAPVVGATTATCGSRIMREQSFDVAVVDEAGQLTEPGTFLAVERADRFVLVGDHQQLPPVVQSEPPADGGDLSRSLFERLVEAHPDAGVMLDRQYRMAQRIQYFSSREFYDGKLRPATPAVAGQAIDDLPGVSAGALPDHLQDQVAFVDPGGSQDGNRNPAEAAAVVETVQSFLDAGVDPDDVGVIAPFRAQVAEISRRAPDGVAVDTVDRFQGSSKEVVVVSFVATGDLDGPIFEDHRRMNVALTRAKKALVLVGDERALAGEDFYARMLDWAR
ncbi:MAG: AAA domain-containing protein [Haloarculaceae archaeon]